MIEVKMSVSTNIKEVRMNVHEDQVVKMKVETPIYQARIPSNYGLITWNGSVITVS